MNNLKLKVIFTILIAYSGVLLFTLSTNQITNQQHEEKVSNKSIISIDNQIDTVYIEYTDDIQATKDHTLASSLKESTTKRKLVLEEKRVAALKLAEEKRVAEAKRIAEEKRQIELAKVAEEKRIIEVARIEEEKRVAALVAKREAKKNKKNKKNQVVSVSRSNSSNVKTYVYEVTAYTAGVESTGKRKGDKNYGLTASGAYVSSGRTIACPRSIPFGTKIEIEGYGVRVCEDRGAHIVNGRLDIYMEDLSQAQQFGRQKMQVKIYLK